MNKEIIIMFIVNVLMIGIWGLMVFWNYILVHKLPAKGEKEYSLMHYDFKHNVLLDILFYIMMIIIIFIFLFLMGSYLMDGVDAFYILASSTNVNSHNLINKSFVYNFFTNYNILYWMVIISLLIFNIRHIIINLSANRFLRELNNKYWSGEANND